MRRGFYTLLGFVGWKIAKRRLRRKAALRGHSATTWATLAAIPLVVGSAATFAARRRRSASV